MADQTHWEVFEARNKKHKMNLDELKAHLEERRSRWYYPLTVVYYRTRRFILDIPFELRMFWQRLIRGYDDSDIWGLHYALTKFTYPRIKEFTRWQSEHGRGVPADFENDPAGWLEVLNKITKAFENMAEEEFLLGEERYPSVPERSRYGTEAEYDRAIEAWRAESIRRDEETQQGLELFGKYLRNLWD